MTKEETKQTVKEVAIEAIMASAEILTTYGTHTSLDDFEYLSHDEIAEAAFVKGTEWQAKQSPWISVKERLPDENEDIIILCKHGAIFNGTYSNNVWFCMDGYIHDMYKGNPIYSSMSSIPSSWEPIAWMPRPKFEE
ncbi:DUF551 domain-containing protein [Bacteroides ovatus]|uniref:DUF551 domain-containing protein n=1 Tax=Bacteroides ovatus TaxID=28116 RepID=A0A9P4DUU4_BACOV|nr:DUF551 domain-containing protein [Bacteroides ovatus]KAA3925932.1 DUF551 domain-containing protein [Bacteroides ovatus]